MISFPLRRHLRRLVMSCVSACTCTLYVCVQCTCTCTCICIHVCISIMYTSIKNNCLKLKNEVGMEVLKSKQTRVYRDNQHIRIVHPYACFFRLVRLCDTTIYFYSPIQLRLYSISSYRFTTLPSTAPRS